jgi:hypothetical protein
MCTGVALVRGEIPSDLFEEFDLRERVHERGGGEPEVRFLWRHPAPLLPVIVGGQLRLVRWGCRERRGRLPPTGWTWQATVEAGGWNALDAEPVDIPANFGLEKGVWFGVREGARGLLVRDEAGQPCVYMICAPATRYYRVMTRSERMPLLMDQTI